MKQMRYGLIAAAMLCVPMAGTASIRDGLESMYMVTGNEPTIYQSQRRHGMDFGYLRLRAPVSTYSITNFSPPQFNAGCGGIDLYGGSFSYINADQFRQMLRQIGANALGYAFKIALASMCPMCNSVIEGLSDQLQKMNELQVDTCKWGAGIAIDTIEALTQKPVEERFKADATGAGSFQDTWEATQRLFTFPGEAVSGGDPSGCDPSKPTVCNLTINALRLTNAGDTLQFPATDGLDHDELMMNIAGTVILRAASALETGAGLVNEPIGARLSYIQLKNGMDAEMGSDNDAHPLQRCATGNTACYAFEPVARWGLQEGVSGWVRGKLEAAAGHMANEATAGTEHSMDLQVFLGSMPLTVTAHLMALQGNMPGLIAYVQAMAPYLTDVYASFLALNIHRVIQTAYSEQDAAPMPPHVKDALDNFYQEAKADLWAVEAKFAGKWKEAEEIVERHTKKAVDPGNFTSPGQQ